MRLMKFKKKSLRQSFSFARVSEYLVIRVIHSIRINTCVIDVIIASHPLETRSGGDPYSVGSFIKVCVFPDVTND